MIDSFHGEHGFLSNFWPVKVFYEMYEFPSVENAYQAAKYAMFADFPMCGPHRRGQFFAKEWHTFRTCTPGQAKRLARTLPQRPNWDKLKLPIMEGLLRQKFYIPELHDKLLATKPHELVEYNTWNDTYWGVCKGIGDNNLGKLLMKIRDEQ